MKTTVTSIAGSKIPHILKDGKSTIWRTCCSKITQQWLPRGFWHKFSDEFVRKYYRKAVYGGHINFFDSIEPLHSIKTLVEYAYTVPVMNFMGDIFVMEWRNEQRFAMLNYLVARDDVDKQYLYQLCADKDSLDPEWQKFTDKLFHDYVWRIKKIKN